MFEIKGFKELERQLRDAQEAISCINGEFAQVHFDPQDQSSIDAAIAEMESAIDNRLGRFDGNLLVEQLSSNLKSQYRNRILELALQSKQEGGPMTVAQGIDEV